MAFNDNQNRDITNTIVDNLKMNPITDVIPKTVIPSIQPTFDVDSYHERALIESQPAINAVGAAIYTADSINDTFITAVSLSVIKDVTSTSTNSTVTATVMGVAKILLALESLTLTPQAEAITLTFKHPIKVDKGFSINVNNSTATGNISARGSIIGFIRTP